MNRTRTLQRIIPIILVSVLLVSCSALRPASTPTLTSTPTSIPTPTVTPSPTPIFPLPEGRIIFEIDPDRKFSGTVYGQGETAIIMANMSQGGEIEWNPFIKAVDKQKFTVITFNYLQPDYSGAAQDTIVVLDQLRNSGYKRVACIGASLGVSACGAIAAQPEMIGIVIIAGPNYGDDLSKIKYPKLFIAGELDTWAKATQTAYKVASEPKTLVLFPDNGVHGASLFYSLDGDKFLKLLIDFVNNLP